MKIKAPQFLIQELSVIIPVYNGQRTIKNTLEGVFSQTYYPQKFEVVVVNDGSKDKTLEIVSKFPIILVDLKKNKGRITARNTGVEKARYKYVLFIDADEEPDPTWIFDTLSQNYEPIQGQVINTSKKPVDRFFYLLRKKYYKPIENPVFITPDNFFRLPKGLGNFLCSKDLYKKVKFTNVGEFFSDDQHFIYEIGKIKKVLAIPRSIVHHDERPSYKKLLIQWVQRGSRFADFYLKKGGILEKQWNIGVVVGLILFITALIAIRFNLEVLVSFLVLFLAGIYIITIILLSEKPKDILIVSIYLIPISVAFLFGILRRKLI